MANKTLMFKTDAGKELNVAQVLEPRIKQAEALGAETVTQMAAGAGELPVRLLARDKDGNVVANPILTEMLNTEFINVIRRDWDGKEGNNGLFVTFSSTTNDEFGDIDNDNSLLVSLNDLIVNVNVPSVINSDVTSEDLTGDPACKYYGKPIRLDASGEQEELWKLVYDRTVRLHKNNGDSIGGKWELDMEAIRRRTPNVLHLEASSESEYLSIDLNPSVVQTIPVIFTPDDSQEQFKLVLFIKPFDQRPAQKHMKILNSTTEPAEAVFIRPWVIVNPCDDTTLTGAKGEGGAMKCAGLTNCVKAVDSEDGSDVTVTVTVVPRVAAFNTEGTLDAVMIPSVPQDFEDSQLKNLVENGLFVVDAVVSATGYESVELKLSVCINAEDERKDRMIIVIPEGLDLSAVITNAPASEGELVTTTRHNEDVVLDDPSLATAVSGIKRKDGNSDVALDSIALVNTYGASEGGDPAAAINPLYVVHGELEPTAYILVKCEADDFVPATIKLPVKVTDKRLPDDVSLWTITWATPNTSDDPEAPVVQAPAVEIPESESGYKGDPVKLVVKELTEASVIESLKDQWGHEETVEHFVVGVVDAKHPMSPDTADVVNIGKDAEECWVNISILTTTGLLINKRVVVFVEDNRAEQE